LISSIAIFSELTTVVSLIAIVPLREWRIPTFTVSESSEESPPVAQAESAAVDTSRTAEINAEYRQEVRLMFAPLMGAGIAPER
jgi:hypothetical protein